MSDTKAHSAHEAPRQKRLDPQSHATPLPSETTAQSTGVALLERGSVAAPPSLPSEVIRRGAANHRGLGPTSIDLMLQVQRRHGNRQTANALSQVRAPVDQSAGQSSIDEVPASLGPDAVSGGQPRSRLATTRIPPAAPNHGDTSAQLAARFDPPSEMVPRTSVTDGAFSAIQRQAVPGLVAPPKVSPAQDPKFVTMKNSAGKVASHEKAHPAAASKAAEAQAAAVGPANEVTSKASAKQVEQMGAKEPGAFDKRAFIEAVKAAISRIAPKNQSEADEFKSSGKAGQVKGEVAGMVAKGKEGAAEPIKETAQAAPNPAGATPKPVTPMPTEQPGPAPAPVNAAAGMPAPRPAEQTNLAGGPAETNKMMADAGVSEKQLTKSNESQFQQAAAANKKLEAHAASAPKAVKADEQVQLGKAGAAATATSAASTTAMHQHRAGVLGAVQGGKSGAKSKDEAKRAEIATKLEGIYTRTKTEVTAILTGLDAKVNSAFDSGEQRARAAFESHVDSKMRAYKDKRYSGLDGAAQWVVDKFTGLPPEVNAFYTEGRDLYLKQMDGVINSVAGVVEAELNRAKTRAVQGKKEIADAVNALPKNLQAIGKEVQGEISQKFDLLDQEINAKQEALVQNLAEKYAAARDAVDQRISAMQAENTGLFDAAKNAISGVIETIKNLKDMLLGVLKRAAGAIDKIIDDPIQFLSNLVSAIKQGFMKFVGNIGKHLKDGLMGWLLGELAAAGIRMPKSLDFMGILDLVLQVMGLTYDAIRARAVKIVGEPTVKRIEQVAEVFKVLITEGPAGLWKWIVDKVDNLVDTVLGGIKDLVITKVITAGITWLISMLNPASAFVKACKMIYDVIMFFVERGSQIMQLVNAIIDSVEAIASGALEGAANFIENALAKALPVAISFLASLLGLGGLSEKIKKIIEEVQKPVGKAVDMVINTVVKGFKKVAGFVGGLFGKGKDKDKEKGKEDDRTPAQKDQAEKQAALEGEKLLKAPDATADGVRAGLPGIKTAFKLSAIDLKKEGETKYRVHTEIQRAADSAPIELAGAGTAAAPPGFEVGNAISVFYQDNWLQARVTEHIKPGSKGAPTHRTTALWVKYQFITGPGTRSSKVSSTSGYAVVEELTDPMKYSTKVDRHTEFEPKNMKVDYDKEARTRTISFDYGAEGGMRFETTQNLVDFLTTKVSGKNLRVKPVPQRGKTESAVTHEVNKDRVNAHLIGDLFGGSGYRQALNLISATQAFNDQMSTIEREIRGLFRTSDADSMDMDVEVEWGDFVDGKALTAVEEAATQQVLAKIPDTNAEKVKQYIRQIRSMSPVRPKICNKVTYVVVFARDGKQVLGYRQSIGPDKVTL